MSAEAASRPALERRFPHGAPPGGRANAGAWGSDPAALAERVRVARELHDGLLQDAMTIALQLRALLPEVRAASESAARALLPVLELAERTTSEARRAIMGLRLTAWDETSIAAIERAVRRSIAPRGMALSFAVRGRVRRIDPGVQDTVVRIAQEAATNAARHSGATVVRLTLVFARRRLHVAIRDDGWGFDPDVTPSTSSGHFGLTGMRERAHVAGGSLKIHSRLGVGTAVVLEVPLTTAHDCSNE